MEKSNERYQAYIQILREELVMAMGCTEPIALAYGAAKCREVLGSIPSRVVVEASGSIIKNVKSVIVPNTGHLKGIQAAAGSDARMYGCEMPVVINSGSGNQGITCSVPVIEYARDTKTDEERMLRALALSNLIAIHQKTGIGRLSAFCGAVCAGVAAGAGIAYLKGGGEKEIFHTVVNGLAVVSGIVCDGAKPSCAAKIAMSVRAGLLGYDMYIRGQQFHGGDGIVTKGADETIENIGRLGREGMRETNEEIIKIMIGKM